MLKRNFCDLPSSTKKALLVVAVGPHVDTHLTTILILIDRRASGAQAASSRGNLPP